MERLRWAARRQIQPAPDGNEDQAHIWPDRERGSLERKQEVEDDEAQSVCLHDVGKKKKKRSIPS